MEKIKQGCLCLDLFYWETVFPGNCTGYCYGQGGNMNENVQTPAGKFSNCLKTEETNALKPKEKEFKYYAAGIGLVQEEELRLVKYGFIK